MADTSSKKNTYALLDDDEDAEIVVSNNMRATKNPNKGGNPKKQRQKTDRKAGAGSQPIRKKPSKAQDKNELIRSYSSIPEEVYDDEEGEGDEEQEKKEYVDYEQYQKTLVINATKAPRKVTEKENVVMPAPVKDDTEFDDEVVNHKKGKKNKDHNKKGLGNVVEIITMDLKGPTLDPDVQPRGTFNNGDRDRNNRRNLGGKGDRVYKDRDDRNGGGNSSGRGRGNKDRDGGNFQGKGRGNREFGGRGNIDRDGSGRGNRDRAGGRGNRDRDSGRGGGRGGREGGRGPYRGHREGGGRGGGIEISSESEFPSLGKAV